MDYFLAKKVGDNRLTGWGISRRASVARPVRTDAFKVGREQQQQAGQEIVKKWRKQQQHHVDCKRVFGEDFLYF